MAAPRNDNPTPPPPQERTRLLPVQKPKSSVDDAAAPGRLDTILASPTYRQADQDVSFLNQDNVRGPRLELDYLKAELLLEQHGIAQTIAVFGSTRIVEPACAQREVDRLTQLAASSPDDACTKRELAVAKRILDNSRYYDVAREFGQIVASQAAQSDGCRIFIMTGGGPGIMEAANRGAYDRGAKSIGLNITLPHEQFPNPYITPELCFRFHYFALRKLHFLMRARALVAFPGGYGTFDELFEALALVQTRKIKPLPIIMVGESYWRQAVNIDFLAAEGVIDPEDRQLFWYAETAAEIWDGILKWYVKAGTPLNRCEE
jgi:uncharacterized protein (TIGR00730 family)